MTIAIGRRTLIEAGLLGLGALAVPGTAMALLAARGFTHNVASGEPRRNSVMLWTRYLPAVGDSARLAWQVSATPDFARVLREGEAFAEGAGDYTVKPVVDGLLPGRYFYYRFRDMAGNASPVGRTRTLPDGPVARFTIGVFSCSNLGFGWFNAYSHAAGRQDIDLMLHLGDYLYEYERGKYPALGQALPERFSDPANEMVQLADYRLRYASYRADSDLQRLHQLFPMVMMWDDHESANDSWKDGAENHQSDKEGDWPTRKAIAMRVAREWLPLSDNAFESYQIGQLATLFRPETRLTGRSRPLNLRAAFAAPHDAAATLADPARTMMGPEQERLLAKGLARSTRQQTRWQIVGQQTIMGTLSMPPKTAGWGSAGALGLAASRAGLPLNPDSWDGYPAARERLLKSALDADANLIVLTGDTHNAWAFDLDLVGAPAGVELAGQSVTSPGYENGFAKVNPADFAKAMVEHNPRLRWANTHKRGYMTLELTPERATSEWVFLDTVRQPSTAIAGRHRMTVAQGAKALAPTSSAT